MTYTVYRTAHFYVIEENGISIPVPVTTESYDIFEEMAVDETPQRSF